MQVDLNEFFGDEDFDLYSTNLLCDECGRKVWCGK